MPRTAYLRAADADRERTASELSRHCAEGRLTLDELSERLDAVYAARTLGELSELGRDLPSPAPARRRMSRRARAVGWSAAVAVLLACGVLGAGAIEVAAHDPVAAVAVVMLLVLCLALAVAVLVPLVVALAPLVALVVGARWVARELGHRRGRAMLPSSRLGA